MAGSFVFEAMPRTDLGRGYSRRLRVEGKVPAVLYGAGGEPDALMLNHNKVVKALHALIEALEMIRDRLFAVNVEWRAVLLCERFEIDAFTVQTALDVAEGMHKGGESYAGMANAQAIGSSFPLGTSILPPSKEEHDHASSLHYKEPPRIPPSSGVRFDHI